MSLKNLKSQLTQFEHDLKKTYKEFQVVVNEYKQIDHVYCYFDSSVLLHKGYSLIIASFFVKNLSTIGQKSPVILLKVSSEEKFDFSGKYKTSRQTEENMRLFWEQVEFDNLDSDTYYCFRPIEVDELGPYDQLSFQQFQIKLPKNSGLTVDGYVYFNESNDGVKAVNRIDLQL